MVHQEWSSSPVHTDICFLWLLSYQFLSFWLYKYTVSIFHQKDQIDEKDDDHKSKRRNDSDGAGKHREESQTQNRDGGPDRERDNDQEKVSKVFGPWEVGIDFKNEHYCPCCACHDVIE